MCSACSGDYEDPGRTATTAPRKSEGRYDRYRSVAPHLRRTMELRQELHQEPPEKTMLSSEAILRRQMCEHTEQRWDASWGAFICMNVECRKVMVLSELWSTSL
jgi:hypothetical protein